MKTLIAFRFLFALVVPSSRMETASEFGSLTPQEVSAKLKQKNVYVFDNNDPDVFKAGHVPHAKWLHPFGVRGQGAARRQERHAHLLLSQRALNGLS